MNEFTIRELMEMYVLLKKTQIQNHKMESFNTNLMCKIVKMIEDKSKQTTADEIMDRVTRGMVPVKQEPF